ncbi:ribonuclease Z, partial [Streptomyces sp. SID11233]|nr:ribonuclease Z [Streptomyces sp. SID11233]
YFRRLRYATAYYESVGITPEPVHGEGVLVTTPAYTLETRRLSHPVETFGYRLTEPDGVRMRPEALAAHGIEGPDVGRLRREGVLRGVR